MHNLGHHTTLCHALNECYDTLGNGPQVLGEMHCPKCGGNRRMAVQILHASGDLGHRLAPKYGPSQSKDRPILYPGKILPSLLLYKCTQCDTRFTVVVYEGRPGEPHIAIFPSVSGGLATPHTPTNIAYYLDQAQRAGSVTANSAAICMYRAALEHLLFEKGFVKGMLDAKIKELEEQIIAGTPPVWARDLDTEYLRVMKELGNAAIHVNGGDITKQAVFDDCLLVRVEMTFQGLLDLAYEEPIRRIANLSALKSVAASVKK
jgi:Domain of unknown function (DUF4145)